MLSIHLGVLAPSGPSVWAEQVGAAQGEREPRRERDIRRARESIARDPTSVADTRARLAPSPVVGGPQPLDHDGTTPPVMVLVGGGPARGEVAELLVERPATG